MEYIKIRMIRGTTRIEQTDSNGNTHSVIRSSKDGVFEAPKKAAEYLIRRGAAIAVGAPEPAEEPSLKLVSEEELNELGVTVDEESGYALADLGIKELREYAAINGVDVKGLKSKAAIIDAIEAALNEAPPAVSAGGVEA